MCMCTCLITSRGRVWVGALVAELGPKGCGYRVPSYQFVLQSAPYRNRNFPKIACGPYFWQRPVTTGDSVATCCFPARFLSRSALRVKGGPAGPVKNRKQPKTTGQKTSGLFPSVPIQNLAPLLLPPVAAVILPPCHEKFWISISLRKYMCRSRIYTGNYMQGEH
jgi:hypothetical protein